MADSIRRARRMLPDDVVLKPEGGVFFIGEKGVLLHETYGPESAALSARTDAEDSRGAADAIRGSPCRTR